jgi:SAM-dependent methyltransferase
MDKKTKESLDTYNRAAKELSSQYQSVSTEDVLSGLKERLPKHYALDIACGNGRDAKWLAEQGFIVDAVDGAGEMIEQAKKMNAHANVSYSVDLMPSLENIKKKGRKYDALTMSAAWMHLNKADRASMFNTLMELSNPGATIFITLRHGPHPSGRPMFSVNADELSVMAARELIHFEHIIDGKDDKLGRGEVWWDSVCLKVPEVYEPSLPFYRDSIIKAPKNTSYKLGFASCLIDMVHNEPSMISIADDARYALPLGPIMMRWASLYDDLAEQNLQQIKPNKRLIDPMNVTRSFNKNNKLISPQDLLIKNSFKGEAASEALQMMRAVKKAIVDNGPVKYIKRTDSDKPVFTFKRPEEEMFKGNVIELNKDALTHGFGELIVSKDIIEAAKNYRPLIEAGIYQSWTDFMGISADLDQIAIDKRLSRVLKAA